MTWLASAFFASRERLRAGTMSKEIQRVCPVVRKRGSVTRSESSWMHPRVSRQQIQNLRAFMRQRVKCLDSSIRWKMETLSSICVESFFSSPLIWKKMQMLYTLKESEEATELSSWLVATGDGPTLGGRLTGTD